jgi:hypothetical protein
MSKARVDAAARAVGIAVMIGLGLLLAPAANAAFIGTHSVSTAYSTATIPVPAAASFPVTASCTKVANTTTVSVTATGAYPGPGTVEYANYYELVVRNPAGAVQFTGDLNSPLGRSYTGSAIGGGLTWKYEIRAKRIVNPSNTWSSQPLIRNATCNGNN